MGRVNAATICSTLSACPKTATYIHADSITCLQPHPLVWFQPQRLLCRKRVAGDQVGEAVVCTIHPQPVSIHLLRMSGEIRHHEESLNAAVTDVAEEMRVAGLDQRCVTIVNRRLLL